MAEPKREDFKPGASGKAKFNVAWAKWDRTSGNLAQRRKSQSIKDLEKDENKYFQTITALENQLKNRNHTLTDRNRLTSYLNTAKHNLQQSQGKLNQLRIPTSEELKATSATGLSNIGATVKSTGESTNAYELRLRKEQGGYIPPGLRGQNTETGFPPDTQSNEGASQIISKNQITDGTSSEVKDVSHLKEWNTDQPIDAPSKIVEGSELSNRALLKSDIFTLGHDGKPLGVMTRSQRRKWDADPKNQNLMYHNIDKLKIQNRSYSSGDIGTGSG